MNYFQSLNVSEETKQMLLNTLAPEYNRGVRCLNHTDNKIIEAVAAITELDLPNTKTAILQYYNERQFLEMQALGNYECVGGLGI